ncbi:MAG: hypothetical protein KDJ39_06140 [Gammaproteobacteria bacterium]|nr:hypothetical protein [Gammaproteobacteria bacterium]
MTERQERLVKCFPDLNKNLEILAEECAEVIQSKSKLIRFGLNHNHHVTGRPAVDHLQDEIGDVLAMIDILVAQQVLDPDELQAAKERKLKKLESWYDT